VKVPSKKTNSPADVPNIFPAGFTPGDMIAAWDAIIGHIPDLVLLVDLDLQIRYANHASIKYGWERGSLLNQNYRSLGLDAASQTLWTDTLRSAAVSKKVHEFSFMLTDVQKKPFTVTATATPSMDTEGEVNGFTIVLKNKDAEARRCLTGIGWQLYRRFVVDLFSNLSHNTRTEYDWFVNICLRNIGQFFELDRSYLMKYDIDQAILINTHEWCAEGITPEKENLQNVPLALAPEWIERHFSSQSFIVNDVRTLPPNGFTRKMLDAQGIKSLITCPLISNGVCIGFIGCDSVKEQRTFGQEDEELLKLLAELIVDVQQLPKENRTSKELSSETRLLRSELEKSNERIKELKEFAYMASHNFIGPVDNIANLIDCFDLAHEKEPMNGQIVQKLRESVEKIRHTFNGMKEILSVTDEETIRMEPLRFSQIFDHICALLHGQIKQSCMVIHTDWGVDEVIYSRAHLENFMLNLLSNAIKYRSPDRNPELTIVTRSDKRHVELSFADNGKGIDLAKHGNSIFKIYKRFHNQTDGRGLGLYLIKAQLEKRGGHIEVESTVGKGTTFKLYIQCQYIPGGK
jgi:signal transduction histidine kinase